MCALACESGGLGAGRVPDAEPACFSCNTMSLSLNQLWVHALLGLAVHLSVWSPARVADS